MCKQIIPAAKFAIRLAIANLHKLLDMHVYCRCLDFTDILALEIDVHYMIFCLQNSLKFNPSASIFQKFPEGLPPDPLALACYAY